MEANIAGRERGIHFAHLLQVGHLAQQLPHRKHTAKHTHRHSNSHTNTHKRIPDPFPGPSGTTATTSKSFGPVFSACLGLSEVRVTLYPNP